MERARVVGRAGYPSPFLLPSFELPAAGRAKFKEMGNPEIDQSPRVKCARRYGSKEVTRQMAVIHQDVSGSKAIFQVPISK